MAIPNIYALMLPFLRLLSDGREHSVRELEVPLAEFFKLSEREWNIPPVRGNQVNYRYRFGWSRTYLKQTGLIESDRRGVFKITSRGLSVLSDNPREIDKNFLKQFKEVSDTNRVSYFREAKEARDEIVQFRNKGPAPKKLMHRKPAAGQVVKLKQSGTRPAASKLRPGLKYSPGLTQSSSPKPEAATKKPTHHVVDVYFGTDRKTIEAKELRDQFTNERGKLQVGVCKVSIPYKHKIGELEEPKWSRLQFTKNPDNHVVLIEADFMSQRSFSAVLKEACQNPSQSAFVFVHGYNVSFEDAARRTAQIAFDLGQKSTPAFYSWPSHGSLKKYKEDESNIEWTEPNLKKFLTTFAEKAMVQEIFVIAHSMGARAVTRVIAQLRQANSNLCPQFRELILAAPDIDADVFKDTLLPALTATQQNVTLYASSNDKALNASKKYHGHQRAGHSKPSVVVVSGLETIDASEIDTGFFGHSYFAEKRTLLIDLALLLNSKLRAAQRPALIEQCVDKLTYWAFKP